MGTLSIWHWLVVLLVIVLLFGTKKIPELARSLGQGIREFKKVSKEMEKETDTADNETSAGKKDDAAV